MRLLRRSSDSAPSGGATFDERLSVPLWWWFVALGVVGLVAFEVNLGHPGVPIWLPVALLAPLVAGWLARLGAVRVTVGPDDAGHRCLRVGSARLPLRAVGAAVPVEPSAKRLLLGPEFDPAAFLVHRAWVGPMVRVAVDDADDPTPYWLFSVRRPELLLAALRG